MFFMLPRDDWHETHKDNEWKAETEDDMTYTKSTTTTHSSKTMRPPTRAEEPWTVSVTVPSWVHYTSTTTRTTLATSPSSVQPSAVPDHTNPSATPESLTSPDESYPTSTGSGGLGSEPFSSDKDQHGPNHVPMYAAAAIVPVIILAVVGAILFFCLKKRKKQRLIAAGQVKAQEMKARNAGNAPTVQAYMAPTMPLPRQPSYTNPPNHPPPPSPTSPQPVILGPISAGSNGNYMTGIDTSDVVSVRNERTGLGDPFADGNSLHEEPPPPYRPRSVAPLSRDSSLRIAEQPDTTSLTNLIAAPGGQHVRSPFDDPREDDAMSELSGPTLPMHRDDMSVASELSYQQDPTVGRLGL